MRNTISCIYFYLYVLLLHEVCFSLNADIRAFDQIFNVWRDCKITSLYHRLCKNGDSEVKLKRFWHAHLYGGDMFFTTFHTKNLMSQFCNLCKTKTSVATLRINSICMRGRTYYFIRHFKKQDHKLGFCMRDNQNIFFSLTFCDFREVWKSKVGFSS